MPEKKATAATFVGAVPGIRNTELNKIQFQQTQECFQLQQAQRQELLQMQQQQSQELRQLQQSQMQQISQLTQKQHVELIDYEETVWQASSVRKASQI